MEELSAAFAEQNLHSLPSSTLLSMSAEERMQALQDIHGVLDIPEEDPAIVETKVKEMVQKLAQFEPSRREALDEAIRQNPEYVERCRLAFLRAEEFDTEKAAQRMAAHFALRFELFETTDVLGRDMMISDLAARKEDLPMLENGAIQLLKHRDRIGRPIILFFPARLPYVPYHFPSMVSCSTNLLYAVISVH